MASDWERYNEIVAESKSSVGYSMNENAKAMETFEKKVEVLKNSWRELFVVFAEQSWAFDLLKGITSAGKGLAEFISSVSQFGDGYGAKFIASLIAVNATISVLDTGIKKLTGTSLKEFAGEILKSTSKLTGFRDNVKIAQDAAFELSKTNLTQPQQQAALNLITKELGLSEVKIKNLTKSTKNLTDAQKAMAEAQGVVAKVNGEMIAKTMLLNAAMMAVSIAIGAVISAIMQYSEAQEKAQEEARKFVDTKNDEISKLQQLKKEYNDLIEKQQNGVDVQTELKRVETEILDLMPKRSKAWNDEYNAILDINSAIDEQIKKKQKSIAIELQTQAGKILDDEGNPWNGNTGFFDKIQQTNREYDYAEKISKVITEINKEGRKKSYSYEDLVSLTDKDTALNILNRNVNGGMTFKGITPAKGVTVSYEEISNLLDKTNAQKKLDSQDIENKISTVVEYYAAENEVTDRDFIEEIKKMIREGSALQSKWAIEKVFEINKGKKPSIKLNKPNEIPDTDTGSSTYSLDSLKELYQAGQYGDSEYISTLRNLANSDKYAKFAKMSTEELSKALNDPTLKTEAKEYTDILQEIERVQKSATSGGSYSYEDFGLLKKDALFEVNQELSKTDILLEKIAAQRANSDNDYERSIELQQQEIQLLEKKQSLLHDKAGSWSDDLNHWTGLRGMRQDLIKSLYEKGVNFEGEGDDISATNAGDILESARLASNANPKNEQLKKSYETLKDEIEEFFKIQNDELPKTQTEWLKLVKTMEDAKYEIVDIKNTQVENSFDPKLNQVDMDLQRSESRQSGVSEGTKEYIQEYKTQIELYQRKQALLHEEADTLRLIRDTLLKPNTKEYDEQNKKIDQLSSQWLDLEKNISSIRKAWSDAEIKSVEDTQNKLAKIYKDYYDKQKELEDEAHDQKIKNIDAEIRKLDEKYAKEDYDRDISKVDKKINDKQAEISAITGDTSAEGMARKAKLQEELDELLLEKTDKTEQRKRDVEKETLEKAKIAENDKYDTIKDNLDKASTDVEIFNKTQQDLANWTTETVKAKYKEMADYVGKQYDVLIEKTNAWKEAQTASSLVSTGYSNGVATSSNPTVNKNAYSNQNSGSTEIVPVRAYLESKGYTVDWVEQGDKVYADGKELGKPPLKRSGEIFVSEEGALIKELERLGILKYKNGGLLDKTGLFWGDGTKNEPEYVLNNKHFEALMSAVELASMVFVQKPMSYAMPSVSNMKSIQIDKIETHIHAVDGTDTEELAELVEVKVWNNMAERLTMTGV